MRQRGKRLFSRMKFRETASFQSLIVVFSPVGLRNQKPAACRTEMSDRLLAAKPPEDFE